MKWPDWGIIGFIVIKGRYGLVLTEKAEVTRSYDTEENSDRDRDRLLHRDPGDPEYIRQTGAERVREMVPGNEFHPE